MDLTLKLCSSQIVALGNTFTWNIVLQKQYVPCCFVCRRTFINPFCHATVGIGGQLLHEIMFHKSVFPKCFTGHTLETRLETNVVHANVCPKTDCSKNKMILPTVFQAFCCVLFSRETLWEDTLWIKQCFMQSFASKANF